MDEIHIKRGASFSLTLRFTDDGHPYDVGHVTLESQVRTPSGVLVATLPFVKQPDLGHVTTQIADTSQWPLGRLRCDILLIAAGVKIYSTTFAIFVAQSVTQS